MKTKSIEIIDNFDSFCQISEEWDNLYISNRNLSIYQSHAWIKSWLEVFINKIKLSIIIVRNSDSKIILIAPLMLQKRKFLKFFNIETVQFIGNNRSDYCDFIYKNLDVNIINKIILHIKNQFSKSILLLENISEISPLYKILNRVDEKKILFELNEFNFLDLKNINDIKYKKKNTQNLRRRLERNGELIFISLEEKNDIMKYLDIFFEQHKNKWGVTSLFNSKKNKKFYKKLVQNLYKDKLIDFKIIKQNKTVVAMHFGFLKNKKFYYYKPAFNIQLSRFSPGNILLQYLIEESINNGDDIFDFGTGNERYKKRYSNNTYLNYSYVFSLKNYFSHILILANYYFKKLKLLINMIIL